MIGCDPNLSAATHAKATYGIETVVDYFRSDLFSGTQFDFLISRLLIEHFLEPQTMWVEINRAIKIGGEMAHEVPNGRYVFEAGLPFFVPGHSTFFTPTSFCRLLDAAGFSLDEIHETPGFLRVLAHKTREIRNLSFKADAHKYPRDCDLALACHYATIFPQRMAQVDTYLKQARARGLPIGVYGAGYFYTFLASFTNLRPTELAVVCDGNQEKWDVKIPGLRQPVQAPETLRCPDVMLVVVATQSFQGVLTRLQPYFEQGGRALVFDPEPRLDWTCSLGCANQPQQSYVA